MKKTNAYTLASLLLASSIAFSGAVCHPTQVIRYDGAQLVLAYMVGRAFYLTTLPVGVALEIVV